MKKLYIIAVLFFALTINAQTITYIPMPNGFQENVDFNSQPNLKSCIPFYSHNGFIYVLSDSKDINDILHRRILKINSSTNQATLLSGELQSANDVVFSLTIYNNDIYFSTAYKIYKINNSTNSIDFIIDESGPFVILQNLLYAGHTVYNIDFNTSTNIKCFKAGVLKDFNITNPHVNNNIVYATGRYANDTDMYNKLVILNNNIATPLTNFNNTFAYATELAPVESGTIDPIRINNFILYPIYSYANNGVPINSKLIKLNLNDNTIDYNFFSYTYGYDSNVPPFVLNNEGYITDSNNVFVSNGVNIPTISGLQYFNRNSFAKLEKFPNVSPFSYLNYNNKIYYRSNGTVNQYPQLTASDGTVAGTNSFPVNFELTEANSAFEHNGKIYFIKKNNNFTIQIFQFDGNTATEIVSGLTNFGSGKYIFASGNFLFLRASDSNGIIGLYKIDINAALVSKTFESYAKLTISPNPTTSTLNIQSNTTITSIKIIDITGRSTTPTFENNKIDVSNLSNGVYLIEATTENGIVREKFIKN